MIREGLSEEKPLAQWPGRIGMSLGKRIPGRESRKRKVQRRRKLGVQGTAGRPLPEAKGRDRRRRGQRIKLQHARISKDSRSHDKDFGFYFKWGGSHWGGDFMFLLLILIIKYYLT